MATKKFPIEFNKRVGVNENDILLVNNSDTDIDEYLVIEDLLTLIANTILTGETGTSEILSINQKKVTEELFKKADKVSEATNGNFAGLDANGNLTDSGKKASDFETADNTILKKANVVDNLTSTSAVLPLSANQGKVLNDGKEDKSNKVTSLSGSSTDIEYPSAKLTYDQLALKETIADVKLIQPAIQFLKRVVADGGTVTDKSMLAKWYTEKNRSLANMHCCYFPHLGLKTRTSGVNLYGNKIYDLSLNNYDAVQATENVQSFVGGYIPPNELRSLKYVSGQTQTGEVAFTSKSYLATDSWTFIIALKANKRVATRILTGANSFITIDASTITLSNGTTVLLSGVHSLECGKTAIIEFQYNNGVGLIKVNNVPLVTTPLSGTMTFTRVAYSSTNPFDGQLYYFELQNSRISEAESQASYTFLRSLIQEIESIPIGYQQIATSNYEGIVDGAGNEILEVQNAAAGVELMPMLDFNNWTITGSTTINNSSQFTTVGVGGVYKSILTVGKLYLLTYLDDNVNCRLYNNAGTGATDEIVSSVPFIAKSAFIYFRNGASGTTNVSGFSIKEAGWSDSTAIYNARIAAGDSVAVATRAAAMWCFYDNLPTNGAVYGKLYNWYAVASLALNPPKGWRVPISAEFTQLATFLGGTSVAGGKMKKEGLVFFNTQNTGATNEIGFSAIGGGRRTELGVFGNIGVNGIFGVNNSTNPNAVLYNTDATISLIQVLSVMRGVSLRLIKNEPFIPERGVIRASTTANIASTALQIPIPFGCFVESIRIINKQSGTDLTSVSATQNNTAGTSLGTLITGKTAVKATSTVFPCTQLDMLSQVTDGTVRILGTNNGGEGIDVEVIYRKTGY